MISSANMMEIANNLKSEIENAEFISLPFNQSIMEPPGSYKDNIDRIMKGNKAIIKETFTNNEYLMIHCLTGKLVGYRAEDRESDRPILQHMLQKRCEDPEHLYCFMDIGNVDEVYKHYDGEKDNVGIHES